MPVGAVIGSAVVGAGASAIGASKNSKAINRATDAQTDANREAVAAQREARAENLALQRPIYNAGMPAINARNALLGLGGTQPAPTPGTTPTPGTATMGTPNVLAQYQGPNPDTSAYSNRFARAFNLPEGNAIDQYYGPNMSIPPQGTMNANALTAQNMGTTAVPQGATVPGVSAQQAANDAFDIFKNSTGYQFRVNEGNRALNSGWAGAGALQSGAAMRAAQQYGQNIASAEFGNFMGYLGEQQGLATGAANAMSGVNSTYANNTGNLAIAQGQNLANAAVARANNSNALIGGLANTIGTGVGILNGWGKI